LLYLSLRHDLRWNTLVIWFDWCTIKILIITYRTIFTRYTSYQNHKHELKGEYICTYAKKYFVWYLERLFLCMVSNRHERRVTGKRKSVCMCIVQWNHLYISTIIIWMRVKSRNDQLFVKTHIQLSWILILSDYKFYAKQQTNLHGWTHGHSRLAICNSTDCHQNPISFFSYVINLIIAC